MTERNDRGRDGRPPFFMVYRHAFRRICAYEPASLRPYMLMAYCCIADHINGKHEADGAFPSYGRMAKETGISRASAIRAVNALEAVGVLSVTARQDDQGDRTSNLYVLNFLPEVVSHSDHPAEVVSDSDHGGTAGQSRVVSEGNPNKTQEEQEIKEEEGTAASGGAPSARFSPLPPTIIRETPETIMERANQGKRGRELRGF